MVSVTSRFCSEQLITLLSRQPLHQSCILGIDRFRMSTTIMRVSAAQLAKELGVTTARISQLRVQGLPEPIHGRFDLVECFRFYTRFLQRALTHRSVPEAGSGKRSILDARRRKLEAEAEMQEYELARVRKQMIAIPDIEESWTTIVRTTRSRLLAVAVRVAPRIVGETDRGKVERLVDGEIREALTEISQTRRGLPQHEGSPGRSSIHESYI